MNQDHVFVDLAVTHAKPEDGEIVGIAVVRTDKKGKVLAAFSERVASAESPTFGDPDFDTVIRDMKRSILNDTFDSSYIVIAAHADTDRAYLREYTDDKPEVFPRRGWLDILALSWPLCYNDMISDRSFESLCRHFKVENTAPNTATGNCEALVRVYWAMMKRYKTALGGEEILREIGGTPLENVRKLVGF